VFSRNNRLNNAKCVTLNHYIGQENGTTKIHNSIINNSVVTRRIRKIEKIVPFRFLFFYNIIILFCRNKSMIYEYVNKL